MTELIIILVRVVSSPLSNLYQKKLRNDSIDPFFLLLVTHLLLSFTLLPFSFFISFDLISLKFLKLVLIFSIFESLGNIFLLTSLGFTDLSIFGPLNAYKPIAALFFSWFFIGEVPGVNGVIGILIIFTGSYIISFNLEKNKFSLYYFVKSKGVYFRLLGVLFTTLGAVFLKKAIAITDPFLTFYFWSFCCIPIPFIFMVFKKKIIKKQFETIQKNKLYILLMVIFILIMQFSTILLFKRKFVSYSLALFQFSSIINVFLGFKVFKEKKIIIKLFGSFIMIIGVILILYL